MSETRSTKKPRKLKLDKQAVRRLTDDQLRSVQAGLRPEDLKTLPPLDTLPPMTIWCGGSEGCWT